ncbi:hypothetical protein [Desulfonatronum parangueonense]
MRICDEVRAKVAQALPDLPPDLRVDIIFGHVRGRPGNRFGTGD